MRDSFICGINIIAVSYTHLDVYKRQEYKVFMDAYRENRALLRFHYHRPKALLTRLEEDVYKRQTYGRTLNIGRVMSPTLALLVQREAEISAFVAETFYTCLLYTSRSGTV